MERYKCALCGYVYSPELGDPDGGVAPGLVFEEVPDSWACPICGEGKNQFSRLD